MLDVAGLDAYIEKTPILRASSCRREGWRAWWGATAPARPR